MQQTCISDRPIISNNQEMVISMQYAPKSIPPRGSTRQPTSKGMRPLSSYKQQIRERSSIMSAL